MHLYLLADHVWPRRIRVLNLGLLYYVARIGVVPASG